MAKPITELAAKVRALGIKNRDLARWLSVREETVCRWLRGDRPPPVALEALIDVLYSKPMMAQRHLKGMRDGDWSAPREFHRQPKRTSTQVKLDRIEKDIAKIELSQWERSIVEGRFCVPSGAAVPKDLRKQALKDEKREREERETEARMDRWLEG